MRRQTKDITLERNEFETSLAELTDQVEISVLDKEVAEERFEAVEAELLETKEKLDELEVEVGVLREENC